jgi:hypothetical protein
MMLLAPPLVLRFMFDFLLVHKEKYNDLYANFQFKNKSNMIQKDFNLFPTLDQRSLELSVTNSDQYNADRW